MTTDDKAQLHVGVPDILVGTWIYRSLLSTPDLNADFASLEFGRGNIEIREAPLQTFDGRIYGPGWQLELKGSIAYGNPFALRFQARSLSENRRPTAEKPFWPIFRSFSLNMSNYSPQMIE